MIIRGNGRGHLYIKADTLWDAHMEQYNDDIHKGEFTVGFTGYKITFDECEVDALLEAVEFFRKNKRESNVVFEKIVEDGRTWAPTYKMRKWAYVTDENGKTTGGPVDIEG